MSKNKQKILLLGGTGFLGSQILEIAPNDVELWVASRNKFFKTKKNLKKL